MHKRVTRGWIARAGIVSAMIAAIAFAAVTFAGSTNTAQAAPGDMTWAVSGGGVQQVGSSFNINLDSVYNAGGPWGGYSMELDYGSGLLSVNSVTAGPQCTSPGTSWANPSNSPIIQTGCAFQNNTTSGVTEVINLTCEGPGVQALHFVTLIEDPVTGSSFFDAGASNIDTTLTDGSVTCVLPITKSDDTGGVAAAGSSYSYTVHVDNPLAFSSPAHTISDTVPSDVTVTGATGGNGAFDGCGNVGNVVTCTTFTANAVTGNDLTITFDVPLSSAGTTNVCNTATLDTVEDSNIDCFDIAPATLTVDKVADAGPYKAGDPISWTITVNSTGGSPAADVMVSDAAADGFDITGQGGSANCAPTGTTAATATWDCSAGGTATLGSGDGPQVLTVTGTVHTPNPADLSCNNDVDVTSSNATTASDSASATCVSKDVQMKKDINGDLDETSENANLFLSCTDPSCTALNPIVINEWALNVSGDPQGVGAFEFDVLYDSSLFDISIDPTGWLYSTGRIPGDVGIGGCAATIITEHDIRFGCVSKNPQPLDPGNGSCLGPDNVTIVDGAVCGPMDDGIIATITVTPKQVLLKQLTPGNDNGAIRTLIDQGCELADIWGHPLSAAPDPSGVDALGREIPLGGIDPGGALNAANCQSLTLTVRILEGDMNTDCVVDVSDDQAEASHYGATFGALLYEPWYDLEPALKDGDVDIKDLQKVFGRNGSTCADPVPPQAPLPQPGDP